MGPRAEPRTHRKRTADGVASARLALTIPQRQGRWCQRLGITAEIGGTGNLKKSDHFLSGQCEPLLGRFRHLTAVGFGYELTPEMGPDERLTKRLTNAVFKNSR